MGEDLSAFVRRLRLKEFFYDNDNTEEGSPINPFRNKSKWKPQKNREGALETYIQAVDQTVNNHLATTHSHRLKDNLTRDERIALKSLQTRRDIVIKPADKGSAVVVMSLEDYRKEANRQLSDNQHYQQLEADPTEDFAAEITTIIKEMTEKESIDDTTKKFLTPLNPRPSRFYLLPKIHKLNNSGRPIISLCDAPTEKISLFVDHHLRPFVELLPSYLRDTTHFLTRIRDLETLPPDTLLVTLDVKSLYTNIPNHDGIKACREVLNTRPPQQKPYTDDLVELTTQILTINNFSFEDRHYLQKQGTAMGTRMAPSYANIFMGKLESRILDEAKRTPFVWWRFIDDIFMIWTHGEPHLNEFLHQTNLAHPTIKFTAEWSTSSVTFLDVRTTLEDGKIQTDLYSKPTDKHQYLAMNSCHPLQCKQAIPYGQALKLRRICSNNEDFILWTAELKQHLVKRGYDPLEIQKQIERAAEVPRETTLQTKHKQRSNRVPLVTTYDPRLPNLNHIVRDHLQTLHISNRLKEAIPEAPITAYRRPKNLGDLLVRAVLKPIEENTTHPGNYPCNSRRCKTCPNINPQDTFQSTTNGRSFRVRTSATCKTKNLVYLIQCKQCKKQYVGETQNPLHTRLNGHRSDINTKKVDKPVAAHFNLPGHSIEIYPS